MSKKQQIILLHGTSKLTANTITDGVNLLTQGEVAIYNAAKKEDVEIYATNNANELVAFPSKNYVDAEIQNLDLDNKFAAVNASIDEKLDEATYTEDKGELDSQISDLQSVTSGYSGANAIKTAVDAKVAQSAYDTKMNALDGQISAINAQINNLNDTYATDAELSGAVSTLEGKITAAQNAATTVVSGNSDFVTVTPATADTGTTYTITTTNIASAAELSALNGRVGTLEGSDSGMSVRDIANNELAKILISGSTATTDALDTLQEIADWIQKHPEDAAKMNTAIQANAKAIEGEIERAEGVEAALQKSVDAKVAQADYNAKMSTLDGQISNLEKVTSGYTGAEAIKTAVDAKVAQSDYDTKMNALDGQISAINTQINNLNDTYATDAELSGAVSTLEGKITAAQNAATTVVSGNSDFVTVTPATADTGTTYTITTTNIASAAELSALNSRVGTLEGNRVQEVTVYKKENGAISEKILTGTTINLCDMVIDCGTY